MEEIFAEAGRLLEAEEPFVLATIVRTRGSTPQKAGAKLLVRPDGTIVGTLGGGCVEADVWQESKRILGRRGDTVVRTFTLTDELAAESGLVCGGTMEILIDPVRTDPLLGEIGREIEAALRGERSVGVATLVRPARGEARAGRKLLVRDDGLRQGTLGDAALDELAAERMRGNLWKPVTETLRTAEGAEVLLETFAAHPTVVIAGAGHIAKALAPLAARMGFRVIVIDDRPQFANPDSFPDADQIIVDDHVAGLEAAPITPNSFIVVATRGHKEDDAATGAAVRSSAGYVGLVGSKRKSLLIFETLLAEGVPIERLRQVRAPVGLDIGARTPEEIALSIMAEIVMVRYGAAGGPMRMEERLLAKAAEKAKVALAR
jgi:xanthine dehydrogenase accessory factor